MQAVPKVNCSLLLPKTWQPHLQLPDGSDGLCCKTRIGTKTRSINPIIKDLAKRNQEFFKMDKQRFKPINAFRIRKAAEIGKSFAENVTRSFRKTLDKTEFSSFLHAKNQRQSPGIDVLCRSSLEFEEATRNLMSVNRNFRKGEFDVRTLNRIDFSDSVFNGNCKKDHEFNCNWGGNDQYRTIDGSCNNLRKPKVGIKSSLSMF